MVDETCTLLQDILLQASKRCSPQSTSLELQSVSAQVDASGSFARICESRSIAVSVTSRGGPQPTWKHFCPPSRGCRDVHDWGAISRNTQFQCTTSLRCGVFRSRLMSITSVPRCGICIFVPSSSIPRSHAASSESS